MIHAELFSLPDRRACDTIDLGILVKIMRVSVGVIEHGVKIHASFWCQIEVEAGRYHLVDNEYAARQLYDSDHFGLVSLGRIISVRLANRCAGVRVPVLNEWYLIEAQLDNGEIAIQLHDERKPLRRYST